MNDHNQMFLCDFLWVRFNIKPHCQIKDRTYTCYSMRYLRHTVSTTGEWDNACNELQRMLVVRSLRQDRISFCVTQFIINNRGSKFVEPPVLDMNAVVEDSTTRTPLIFVLSSGVVRVLMMHTAVHS